MRRFCALLYLVRILKKERPNRSAIYFLFKAIPIPTDDLVRIADAIERFGLNNLI